jgi:RNA polymerase sigma factor (sigma-70 family)
MNPTSNEIEELARRACEAKRAGRDAEVRELLAAVVESGLLLRITRRTLARCGNPRGVDQEDLAQDLWLRLCGKIDQFDPARSFVVWLDTVCYHMVLDAIRKRSRTPEISLVGHTSDEADPPPAREIEAAEDRHTDRVAFDVDQQSTFSEADWHRLCAWAERNPRTPVVVVTGFCYWRKLQDDPDTGRQTEWRDWFIDCGVTDPDALFARFERTCDIGDVPGRIQLLAEELDLRYNSLWKDWDRKRHLAVELEFFWNTLLEHFEKFSPAQVESLLACILNDRVPILCIDQLWTRANDLTAWTRFRGQYEFRGTAPLFRFLELPAIGDRIELFANSIPGDVDENYTGLVRVLQIQASLRQSLRQ